MSKTLPKIFITFFLLIFTLQLLSLIALLTLPSISQAGDVKFTPQVGIDQQFQKGTGVTVSQSTETIAQYIRAIYKYAIGIVGILAAVVLMFGGIIWLTAGGNATQITNAKSWIGASLTGLVLALLSYMILATVNPALVNFKTTGIQKPEVPSEKIIDPNKFCGKPLLIAQQTGEPIIQCGMECEGGKQCISVSYDYVGAIECPPTPNGSGKYWTCINPSDLVMGCCLSNIGYNYSLMFGYRDCKKITKDACNKIASGSIFSSGKECSETKILGVGVGLYTCQ